jgi:hypothetical protein
MPRILQAFFGLAVWAVAIPAAAQEPTDEPTSKDQQSAQAGTGPAASEAPTAKPTAEEPTAKPTAKEPTDKPTAEAPTAKPTAKDQQSAQAGTEPAAPPPTPEVKPVEQPEGWHTSVTGYFRAPMALGISRRPSPDTQVPGTTTFTGPSKMQISYGPNRTVDASYYSFAYTRLQEQDWAEIFIHEKKKHVEAVVGWLGYWYQSVGFRNPDASWFPGMAYVTLDTDFEVAAGFKPNIALTVGSWWPKFGYFAKYDTYTLGQFRQLGEQVRLTVPVNPDLTATLVHGLGTNRDGSFQYQINPPIYGSTVGLDLIHYANIELTYKKYVDIGLHYNNMWTRDPNLTQQATPGKAYTDAAAAYLTTVGAEVTLSAPYAGRLWISPSYIHIRNGWALGNGGTEVMHSLGGAGIAGNYMAWTNNPPDSTGTGSMFNLGFLYENSLSSILDKPRGSVMPDLTLNVFGLMANASLDLPAGSVITQNKIRQFKYGADLTLQALKWLGFMARWDEVNYDLDHSGYVFSAITGRMIFSTHFLSGESIYVQYSRYRYGDNMLLNQSWPWGTPLVAGSNILQGGPYSGQKPDMDVIKLQATVAF